MLSSREEVEGEYLKYIGKIKTSTTWGLYPGGCLESHLRHKLGCLGFLTLKQQGHAVPLAHGAQQGLDLCQQLLPCQLQGDTGTVYLLTCPVPSSSEQRGWCGCNHPRDPETERPASHSPITLVDLLPEHHQSPRLCQR